MLTIYTIYAKYQKVLMVLSQHTSRDDADRALLYWEDYYPGIACRIYSRTKSVDNFHTALASNSNPRHK